MLISNPMKRKKIFIHPDWEDENIKLVLVEFCKNFWGYLQIVEIEPNVLKGNQQMNLGPNKVGTYSQKNAPMLSGTFTIGVDPVKGKFLQIEYLVDKGHLIKSKQILSRTYWGTVYKTLRKAFENPLSSFIQEDYYKSEEKDKVDITTCVYCGKTIPSSTEFCTFCGAKQEIKEEVILSSEDSKSCISCGKLIPSSTEFCTFCGVNQEIKKVEILSPEDSKSCIKCGKILPISDEFCQFCGANQEVEKVEALDAPNVKPCIKCGKSIPKSTTFCTHCGTKQELETLIQ